MKSIKNKKIVFIIVFLLVISSTVAFLYSTDTFQNIFVAASYKVTVVETFESPDNWVPGDITPKTVTLKNEGTVPIKVRIKFEEEWKDSNNQDLPLEYNGENVSIINFDNEDDYIYKDGYYYYDLLLEPGETTSSIIKSVTFNPNYSGTITCEYLDDYTESCSSSDDGYEGGTYKLKITIEGVQEDYYVQAWGLSSPVGRHSLYNVLKEEAENNGVALKYTGEHHDSFAENPSKDIYHWYAVNDTEASSVNRKSLVSFAGYCWKMLRTTDTGGVKMIYLGNYVDGQCTSGDTHGITDQSGKSFPSEYYYADDYFYDTELRKYKLSGNAVLATLGPNTYTNLEKKYTCFSANVDDYCSNLYYIQRYNDGYNAYAFTLGNYSNGTYGIGKVRYSLSTGIKDIGYMYGDSPQTYNPLLPQEYSFGTGQDLISSKSMNVNYYYGDSITYDSTNNKYSLQNTFKISSVNDYSSLVGKYTFFSSIQNNTAASIYYVVYANKNSVYYIQISDGKLLSDYNIVIGDDITNNGNGTYTLQNPRIIDFTNWYSSYSSYQKKYFCINSNTCSDIKYMTSTTNVKYFYVDPTVRFVIAKERNGLQLVDYIEVSTVDWYNGYYSNTIRDYKYTCGDLNNICSKDTLKMILTPNPTMFRYVDNYYFGNSVTWDGEKYTLQNTIGLEGYSSEDDLNTHHYYCDIVGETQCEQVNYIYYEYSAGGDGRLCTIILNDGIINVKDYLNNILSQNNNSSNIKQVEEYWYEHNLLEYSDYLEDTIYCNNRTIYDYAGWEANGGSINDLLYFQENSGVDSLACPKGTDRFSVSNPSAKLKYPIGLATNSELSLLNNSNIRGSNYFTMSPVAITTGFGFVRLVDYRGELSAPSYGTNQLFMIRPVISLKPNIQYVTGNGSSSDPYIIDTD